MDRAIVFYDAGNSIQRREVDLLKRIDRRHRFSFANIAARGFEPGIFDKTQTELAADLHALLPDGTWIRGSDLVRYLYASVGFGPLVMLTQLPIVRQVSILSFRVFARFTG